MRAVQPAEVLVEQGDSTVPFFVVVSGEIEIVPLQLQQQSRLL
jgi:CRP-like cAMP-binding protein